MVSYSFVMPSTSSSLRFKTFVDESRSSNPLIERGLGHRHNETDIWIYQSNLSREFVAFAFKERLLFIVVRHHKRVSTFIKGRSNTMPWPRAAITRFRVRNVNELER